MSCAVLGLGTEKELGQGGRLLYNPASSTGLLGLLTSHTNKGIFWCSFLLIYLLSLAKLGLSAKDVRPTKAHSNVGEWERYRIRERVPEILARGGLHRAEVHRHLFNKHFDFFF